MNKIRWSTYSEEHFRQAIKNSISIAQVCRNLNLPLSGGHYTTIKKRIKLLKIDTSHFEGQAWSKNKILPKLYPIEFYLKKDYFVPISKLRIRLLKEGIFEHKCQKCLNTEWLGEPIPLELHHIDRDVSNNLLENLQILCPTCHALTHILINKIKRNNKILKQKNKSTNILVNKKSTKAIVNKHGIPFNDIKIELSSLLWQIPTTKIATHFKVSDQAISHWCKKFGLNKPPRGYWSKFRSK